MSVEFEKLIIECSESIANRNISLKAKKVPKNPFFCLILEGNKLRCIWCREVIDKNKIIIRFPNSKCKSGFTPDEWRNIALNAMKAKGLNL
jgi:hypothetical protein